MKKPVAKIAKIVGDRLIITAHDGGDGIQLMHCPFCGSGALVARSDNSTECDSCMTCFTVQVQPQYPFSPQTMQGQDVVPPGMPGNPNDQQEQMGDFNEVGDEGEDPFGEDAEGDEDSGSGGMPGDEEEEPQEDVAAEGDKDESPFPPKQSYLTSNGKQLTEAQYIRYLAIRNSPDKITTLSQLRRELTRE